MLVPEGVLLANTDDLQSMVYVLGTTSHGLLGWRCRARRATDDDIDITFDFESPKEKWSFMTVHEGNLESFRCSAVKTFCPAVARSMLGNRRQHNGIHMITTKQSGGAPLLQFSARTGLRGLTVALLKRLYTYLEVPHKGAMPSTEYTLAFALIKHILPSLDNEQVKSIVALRGAVRKPAVEATICEGDIEDVAQDFGSDEEAVVKKDLKVIAAGKKSPGGAGGVATRSARKEPAKPVQKQLTIEGVLSAEAAKEYLPDVPGCRIWKDTKLHMRWSVAYPKQDPPRSASKAIGVLGDRQAMEYCLRWAWAEHTAATGQPCPWQF